MMISVHLPPPRSVMRVAFGAAKWLSYWMLASLAGTGVLTLEVLREIAVGTAGPVDLAGLPVNFVSAVDAAATVGLAAMLLAETASILGRGRTLLGWTFPAKGRLR